MCRCPGRHLCSDVSVCNFVSRKHDVSRHRIMTSPDPQTDRQLIFIYIDIYIWFFLFLQNRFLALRILNSKRILSKEPCNKSAT